MQQGEYSFQVGLMLHVIRSKKDLKGCRTMQNLVYQMEQEENAYMWEYFMRATTQGDKKTNCKCDKGENARMQLRTEEGKSLS